MIPRRGGPGPSPSSPPGGPRPRRRGADPEVRHRTALGGCHQAGLGTADALFRSLLAVRRNLEPQRRCDPAERRRDHAGHRYGARCSPEPVISTRASESWPSEPMPWRRGRERPRRGWRQARSRSRRPRRGQRPDRGRIRDARHRDGRSRAVDPALDPRHRVGRTRRDRLLGRPPRQPPSIPGAGRLTPTPHPSPLP